jgi:hypothetical protein
LIVRVGLWRVRHNKAVLSKGGCLNLPQVILPHLKSLIFSAKL